MKSKLATNAFANAAQMLLGALLLFVLYRYISDELGVELLGVWSVVLATTSASKLADLGVSAGVTRFVAQNLAHQRKVEAADIVETSFVSLFFMLIFGLLMAYPVFSLLLQGIFTGDHLKEALEMLPFAMVSLWLSMLSSIALSGLDGCQKMMEKAYINLMSQLLLVIFAFVFVPKLGLIGLAIAQIGQGVFLLIVAWFFLRRELEGLSYIPYVWKRHVFKTVFSYGLNVQLAGLSVLLFEPVTKALMAKFGGAAAAGYFEVANQVVLKVRSVIVAANQAVVPQVANLIETNPSKINDLYIANMQMLLFIATPLHASLMIFAPLISLVFVGVYSAEFVSYLQVGILAWFVNVFTFPAYFIGLGSGRVWLNTVVHFMIGILNICFGFLLGHMFSGIGVVLGAAAATIVGSLIFIYLYQRENRIKSEWNILFGMKRMLGYVALLLAVGAYFQALNIFEVLGAWVHMLSLIVLCLPLLLLSWLSPLGKTLMNHLKGGLQW